MMSKTKKELADAMIKSFQEDFMKKFDIYPSVIYREGIIDIKIGLLELEDLINEILRIDHPGKFKDGIRTLSEETGKISRSRLLICYRHTFFKTASDMGYGCSILSKFFGVDHSTVIHARTTASDLMDVKDECFTSVYRRVNHILKEKYSHETN